MYYGRRRVLDISDSTGSFPRVFSSLKQVACGCSRSVPHFLRRPFLASPLHRIFAMPSPPHSSSSYSLSNPSTRLSQVAQHIMGSSGPQPTETLFTESVVPQAPEDPLFGLMAAYRKDESDKKVDLGIGAYRDNNAKPWILPVVTKVGRS